MTEKKEKEIVIKVFIYDDPKYCENRNLDEVCRFADYTCGDGYCGDGYCCLFQIETFENKHYQRKKCDDCLKVYAEKEEV